MSSLTFHRREVCERLTRSTCFQSRPFLPPPLFSPPISRLNPIPHPSPHPRPPVLPFHTQPKHPPRPFRLNRSSHHPRPPPRRSRWGRPRSSLEASGGSCWVAQEGVWVGWRAFNGWAQGGRGTGEGWGERLGGHLCQTVLSTSPTLIKRTLSIPSPFVVFPGHFHPFSFLRLFDLSFLFSWALASCPPFSCRTTCLSDPTLYSPHSFPQFMYVLPQTDFYFRLSLSSCLRAP